MKPNTQFSFENGIDKVDFYYNPNAGYANLEGAEQERRKIAEFFELSVGVDTELIDTRPTPELIAERHNTADPVNRLSVTLGGDRSATDLVVASHTYLRSSGQLGKSVPKLGFGGTGNGLNVHSSLNGGTYARSLSGLLRSGKAGTGELYPMECIMPEGDAIFFTSIAAIGALATINAALEAQREELRGTWKPARLVKESYGTAEGFANYETRFSILSDELRTVLKHRVLASLAIMDKPKIAKVGNVPIPLLGDPLFAMETYMPSDKIGRVVDAVVSGTRLMMGIPSGGPVNVPPGGEISMTIDKATSHLGTTFDGDPGPNICEGDKLRFKRSQTGVQVIYNQVQRAA